MKYRTQCSHCSTQFIIGQEQLNAYGGKVRCGKCSKIFDAMENLQLNGESKDPVSVTEKKLNAQYSEPDKDPIINLDEGVTTSFSSSLKNVRESQSFSAKDTFDNTAPERFSVSEDLKATKLDSIESVSNKFNKIFTLLAVILIILTIIQGLYFIQPQISESNSTRPLAQGFCSLVGCSLELPRDASKLRTEWSDLNYVPEYPNLGQLSINLRNYSTKDVAFPFLQISFKDITDRVLVRKIIPPQDYLSVNDQGKESFASNSNLSIKIQFDFQEVKFNEYEIKWIYP